KFTEQGLVTIRASRSTVAAGEVATLRVSDTGIGMTPEQLARLFQDFTQADASTTRKYGGGGPRLGTSRALFPLVGGDITVESVPGHGSTFTIHLPVVPEPPNAGKVAETAAPGAGVTAPTTRPVLVIDDDPTVRDLMTQFLERQGFAVVGATGGVEGLARGREGPPLAVTLDIMMPDLDGRAVPAGLKG